MPPYTAFTAYTAASIVFAASVLKPFISTVQQLNMANTSEIFSDVSSEVDTSARLSAVETEAEFACFWSDNFLIDTVAYARVSYLEPLNNVG